MNGSEERPAQRRPGRWPVVWVVAVLLAVIGFAWAVFFHREEPSVAAIGVAYDRAARYDLYHLLPEGAGDIHYAVRDGDYFANFRMEERDFLEWAEQRGWKLSPIPSEGIDRPVVWNGEIRLQEIPAGYIHESRDGDEAEPGPMLRVIYDGSRGRVYCSRAGE